MHEVYASNLPVAIAQASDVKGGGINVELLQTAAQQGTCRNCSNHALQLQCWPALRIQNADTREVYGGENAVRLCRDGVNANGSPQRLRRQAFDFCAPLCNSRHNESMESPPGCGKQEPESQHQPQ